MIEQIITSIAFVLLSTSIYLFVHGKMEFKVRLKYLLTSHCIVFLRLLVNFNSELFTAQHLLFLILFSWTMIIMPYVFSKMFLVLWSKLHNDVHSDFYISSERFLLKLVPIIFLLFLIFIHLMLIWNVDNFPANF